MAEDQIQEIKDKLDIVSLINEYLPLKKAGRNYKALCPFHQEKTPSFMVSSELQIFKCFGCNRGGDHFTFLREVEGLEFKEALKLLAEKAGIKLERYTESDQEKRRGRLFKMNHLAAEVFHHLLTSHKVGRAAYRYLENRGITPGSIERFALGYSPHSWDFLGNYLLSKKYTLSEVISAGLVVPKDSGRGFYDRFRGRIMFPLRDVRGKVAGFAGRTLTDDQPKYINSPETEVFSKSTFLYGFDQAKTEIKKQNQAIVVEGLFDVLTPFQVGIRHIVASQGTALTLGQIKLLKKVTDTLAFCYDTDKAGSEATKRGIALAQGENLNLQVVLLPRGKDPDECVREDAQAFPKAIQAAVSINDFYFNAAFLKYDPRTALGKKRISQELLPIIKAIASPVERAHYTKKLAEGLGVGEEIVQEELVTLKTTPGKVTSEKKEGQLLRRLSEEPSVLEEYLLALLFKAPLSLAQSVGRRLAKGDFTPPRDSLFAEFKDYISGRKRSFDIKRFHAKLGDGLKTLAEKLYLRDFGGLAEGKEILEKELESTAALLKNRSIKRALKELARKIKEAERRGEAQKRVSLQRQFQELAAKLS